MGRIRRKIKGQATIEFTFTMIVIIFLIYGMVRVFRWAGMELASSRVEHERHLTNEQLTPEQQLAPSFHRAARMDAAFTGNIIK